MNSDTIVVMIAQVGPTELFLPAGSGSVDGGMPVWLMWAGVLAVCVVVGVWVRAMGQRRVDPREIAFRALSRQMKLSHKQIAALRTMGESSGRSPVGLLMSASAERGAGLEG